MRPPTDKRKNIQVPAIMLHGSKDKLVPYAPNIAFGEKHFSNTKFTQHTRGKKRTCLFNARNINNQKSIVGAIEQAFAARRFFEN